MADSSTSSLILFIASMIVAVAVAGVLIQAVADVSQAVDTRGDDVSETIRTDFEIISDPEMGVYNSSTGNVTLVVKNTGTESLAASADVIDVLVNGRFQTNVTVQHVDGQDLWRPGDVVEITVDVGDLPSGDHRVKIVANGVQEVFEFRI